LLCLYSYDLARIQPVLARHGRTSLQRRDIARESIIAPADIYFTDEDATNGLRRKRETCQTDLSLRIKPGRAGRSELSFWLGITARHGSDSANPRPANSDGKAEIHWTGAGDLK
jgi:hypothetical protein